MREPRFWLICDSAPEPNPRRVRSSACTVTCRSLAGFQVKADKRKAPDRVLSPTETTMGGMSPFSEKTTIGNQATGVFPKRSVTL